MNRRIAVGSIILSLLAIGTTIPAQAEAVACTDEDTGALSLDMGDVAGQARTGRYALPDTAPTTLAVYAHGYGHTSVSWVTHMTRTADKGAAAVAMDYRGSYVDEAGNGRGWFVNEGAEDSIAAANLFLASCPSITNVVLYGVSMGGNTSGLAVAANAKRADDVTPLFDYWVAGEPAANATETYLEATGVGMSGNVFAARAAADIEDEYNGTLAENPQGHLNGTVVARIADIATSGVKGVAIVHGFDDGLVPYNQARELATLLRAAGIPTDFYNAARRETGGTECGTDNTTLTENAASPIMLGATGECYTEPLAGHSTESSQTSLVQQTGLNVVFDLLHGASVPANLEFIVDGEAGIIPLA